MAIKSKSRRKRRGRGRTGAPPPKPRARPVPFARRPSVRRAVVVVVAAAAVVGGLRAFQNAGRAHALRVYVRQLQAAQAPVVAHLTPKSKTYIDTSSQAFGEGKTQSAAFLDLADTWEAQFRDAKNKVAALRPPAQLREAQRLMIAGLEQYIGVARLYNLAAQERQVAAKQPPAAAKAFEDKVQVTLQHAQEWLDRAADVYSLGGTILQQYRKAWLGIPLSREIPGVPTGLLPDDPVTN